MSEEKPKIKTFKINIYNIEFKHPETKTYDFFTYPVFAKNKSDAVKIINDQLSWDEMDLKKSFVKRAVLSEKEIIRCEYTVNEAFFSIGGNLVLVDDDDIINYEYLIDKFIEDF